MMNEQLLNITRTIDLNPEDWLWATWRHKPRVQRQDALHFDKEKDLKRLAKIIAIKGDRPKKINWKPAKISPFLSREEARFWLTAMAKVAELATTVRVEKVDKNTGKTSTHVGPRGAIRSDCDRQLIDELNAQHFREENSLNSVVVNLIFSDWNSRHTCWETPPEIIYPLANLFDIIELAITIENLYQAKDIDFRDFVELTRGCDDISTIAEKQYPSYIPASLADKETWIISEIKKRIPRLLELLSREFDRNILPICTDEEIDAMRDRLRPELNLGRSIELYRFAAHLEMYEELQALVQSWSSISPDGNSGYLIFSLGDVQLIENELRRLHFSQPNPTYICACIAHTECATLDLIRNCCIFDSSRQYVTELMKAFSSLKAPEVAPYMLELMLVSKAPDIAQNWLEENRDFAIIGLRSVVGGNFPVAAKAKPQKMIDGAIAFLRRMKRKGYAELIEAASKRESTEVADKVRKLVLDYEEINYPPFDEQTIPKWLQAGIADIQSRKLKPLTWISPSDLPPIVVGNNCLNEEQIAACLQALRQSNLAPYHVLISGLNDYGDRTTLDNFIWSLFEYWLSSGTPVKEKWAMEALGFLGGDAIALKLTPLIRKWPGEGQHKRAVTGLECLRAIGTDTALMQINGIAQKVKFKGIKARAKECMEAIAEDLNLTREELEDRIIPDCGLDERGSRVFDFGPRQFHLLLGPDLKPTIKDDAGKLRKDLPKPGVKDNADLANQAVAEWKLLKKQINEIAKLQAMRLEQAMVTRRRWSSADFERLFVHHPLMTNIVRLLVWGSYNESGNLTNSFRVTEDQTYADASDEAFELEASAKISIVHPLQLTPEQRLAWGELISDYEIIPPFPQISREIYTLEPDEIEATDITRFQNIKIPTIAIVGTLEKQNWLRGALGDHGDFHEHLKPFPNANITAMVRYDVGMCVGMRDEGSDRIEHCFFLNGIHSYYEYSSSKLDHVMQLGNVDPVIISEVLRDLSNLASKYS